MIARRFAEHYICDNDILEIIELHDEAYNSWCKGSRDGMWDKAEVRAKALIKRLGNLLPLYLLFFQCDSQTGSKETKDFEWFQKIINNN